MKHWYVLLDKNSETLTCSRIGNEGFPQTLCSDSDPSSCLRSFFRPDPGLDATQGTRAQGSPADLEALGQYYRPDMAREGFQSLVGEWDFEYDAQDVGLSSGWAQNPAFSKKINVPYCVESIASGIADIHPPRVVWYARRFQDGLPATPGRTLLNFGAADYRAKVWLNGVYLGEHNGGYNPFRFDVEEHLLESYKAYPDLATGEVRLVLRLAGGEGEATVTAVATSPDGEEVSAVQNIIKKRRVCV